MRRCRVLLQARSTPYLLLFCLLIEWSGSAAAQTATVPTARYPTVESTSTPSPQSKETTIQQNGRFLGWRFAATHPKDGPEPQHSIFGGSRIDAPGELSRGASAFSAFSGLSLSSPMTGSANAGFGFRTGPPTGFIPTAVTAGDFNEDGHMDLAISNGGDNTIFVLLGKGDGTFQTPEVLYTQGEAPVWITAIKLRNNGHLDLAVANGDTGDIEIFPGNGDGTFQASSHVPLTQTPTFLLAGDFNNDGRQDLAVGLVVPAGTTEPQFEILTGNGTGGFSGAVFPPPIVAFDDVPTGWIATADLNNDGLPDIVTTITGAVAIAYLNQSGQSFLKGPLFGPRDGTMVVGLGDMDEDGCVDAEEIDDFGFLTIAKGQCNGLFTQGAPSAPLGDLDPAVQIVDVNGDGHLDVVASAAFFNFHTIGGGSQGGYLVSVLKGDGKGNLSPTRIYRGGGGAFSLAVTDLTGAGRPEIVTANSLDSTATLFLNDGSGGYGAPRGQVAGSLSGPANAPLNASIGTADLNGDSRPDVLFIENGSPDGQPNLIAALLNDGSGQFSPEVRSPITAGPIATSLQYVLGKFRNVSATDMIYVTENGLETGDPNVVAFIPGNGDGTFGTATALSSTLANPLQIVAGDFNHDGILDFVIVGTNTDPTSLTGVEWRLDTFLGHGDGTFAHLTTQAFPYLSGGSPQQIFAIDINHDGKLDLLIGNNNNGGFTTSDDLIEALGKGDGTFEQPFTAIPHFGPVAVADLNGDGLPDLVQRRDPAADIINNFFEPAAITVYLNTPNNGFQKQASYHLPGYLFPDYNPALVGDFNGDGADDIALAYYDNNFSQGIEGKLQVLQGLGNGTFNVTNHMYLLSGLSSPRIGADFNGDGAMDLVELVGRNASFHMIPGAPAPSVSIAFDSTPLIGSESATVALFQPAASTQTVILSANDPSVQLPANITFAAGQSVQDFSFTVGAGFNRAHALALFATLGTETAAAYAAIPNPNFPTGVVTSIAPATFSTTPGGNVSLGMGVDGEYGYFGTFSSFQCSGLPPGANCSFDPSSGRVLPTVGLGILINVNTSASTPFGMYTVNVSATDGSVQASGQFRMGIGDFSLGISPGMVVTGPIGSAFATITSASTNGLAAPITVTCSGLPSSVTCGAGSVLFATQGSTTVAVNANQTVAGDYPFTITGKVNDVSHQISGLLRVGDFTAAIDKTTATLLAGQSVSFNVTLNSVNHYASSIAVICQPTSELVTCAASVPTANLTDSGTTGVQLTVNRTGSRSASFTIFRPMRVVVFVTAMGCILFLPQRRFRRLTAAALFLAFAGCGGGTTSNVGFVGNPTPPAPPTPVTISVNVFAVATSTFSDTSNQKLVGPIQITLQ